MRSACCERNFERVFRHRWDQGVVGMRVGDKRKLTVPPQMAYGSDGIKGVIPGNATLLFDVELCDVKG